MTRARKFGGNDIASLISSAPGVAGVYDIRYGLSYSSNLATQWDEARGQLPSMLAAGAARPTLAADGLAFDGVGTYLRASGATGIPGSTWVALIARGTNTINKREVELSTAAVNSIVTGAIVTAAQWVAGAVAVSAISAAITAAPRIFYSRRTVTVDVASQVGNAAEVTSVSATGASPVTQITVGGDRTAISGNFSNMQGLRAVVIGSGVLTPAISALVNAWAVANHGAVLTN